MIEPPVYLIQRNGAYLCSSPPDVAAFLPPVAYATGTPEEAREWVDLLAEEAKVPPAAFRIVEFAPTGRVIEP